MKRRLIICESVKTLFSDTETEVFGNCTRNFFCVLAYKFCYDFNQNVHMQIAFKQSIDLILHSLLLSLPVNLHLC